MKATFTICELINITNGKYVGDESLKNINLGISTDTRTITADDAYLAIVGAVFDGHEFAINALEKGAKLAIIDEKHSALSENGNFLVVKDTLEAYLKIASFHRKRCSAKIIGVTGSSGKTTTKEFLYSVFASKYKTQKSIKNHNNEIGLCQTLLSIEPDTKYCIVEMGMRGLGEIDLLAKYARPDIAVITNVGTAHIGILGSRENITKAKCEITNYLTNEGILIAHDEEIIKNELKNKNNFKKIFYDLSDIEIIEKDENIAKIKYENSVFELPSSADYDILNALAAIRASKLENYADEEIQKGLLDFQNVEFRNEIIKSKSGALIISDCYNANPDSAQLSIKHICEVYKNKHIIIVFGDMFELGEFEEEYHRKIGMLINSLNVNYFISVGKLAKITAEEVKNIEKKSCLTVEEAAEFLPNIMNEESVVFLKASRGMKFEKIAEIIREK
ncbi:MAG: UDP-N-acetylmuramoyl-tripeptide--D-alanyl-D-alanine ligase [bacterium]|nr:UDP-N-acetylmuramoyl-tripeptide--D-alanyl-D-alanine ligase [bacterium]